MSIDYSGSKEKQEFSVFKWHYAPLLWC